MKPQPPHARSADGLRPIRLLTAVPICDGHDSAINTINLEFVRHGLEVVYLGYHRSARAIARAAIQEDVRAVGLSSYNGGHVEFFAEVVARLRQQGGQEIGVFGGGGGTITPHDAAVMKRKGVDQIFFAGATLAEMTAFVRERYGRRRPRAERARRSARPDDDCALAQSLTAAETKALRSLGRPAGGSRVIGITGAGGAGKSTLIDELVLRFLQANPRGRLAILSHDPSLGGRGALLGDRATMIHSQDDRVFMRSLATRERVGGLAPGTEACLGLLRTRGFDLVLLETIGIGQEARPFARRALVDRTVLVMSPAYGSRLQLQKIAMLDEADLVVVNKADQPGAKTAWAEIEQRLADNGRGQKLVATVAKRHRDPGVDELFQRLNS